jgi:hypothetical protein
MRRLKEVLAYDMGKTVSSFATQNTRLTNIISQNVEMVLRDIWLENLFTKHGAKLAGGNIRNAVDGSVCCVRSEYPNSR